MALCRRVITQTYQMYKKQEYYYLYNLILHEKKMIDYGKFLEDDKIFLLQNSKYTALLFYRHFAIPSNSLRNL